MVGLSFKKWVLYITCHYSQLQFRWLPLVLFASLKEMKIYQNQLSRVVRKIPSRKWASKNFGTGRDGIPTFFRDPDFSGFGTGSQPSSKWKNWNSPNLNGIHTCLKFYNFYIILTNSEKTKSHSIIRCNCDTLYHTLYTLLYLILLYLISYIISLWNAKL